MSDLILESVYGPLEAIGEHTQSVLNTMWWECFLELSQQDNSWFFDNSSATPEQLSELATHNIPYGIQFLAGVLNETGIAERTITISPDAVVFIPIVNIAWVPEPKEVDTTGYPGVTDIDYVKSAINEIMDTAENLSLSIDGIEIPGIANYRQFPNDPFYMSYGGLYEDPIPDDGIKEVGPTYSGGYYVGLNPLTPLLSGHTIEFAGTVTFGTADTSDDFSLNIKYNIKYDFNKVLGTNGKDTNLRGTNQSDRIEGLNGADTILGLQGNDNISGGNGSDRLIGVDPNSSTSGRGEIDVLYGDSGADTFVLGDHSKAYYLGNNSRDYVVIKDFTREDTIQLMNSDNYRFSQGTLLGTSGTAIYLGEDLIAFVEGATQLTQASSQLNFV